MLVEQGRARRIEERPVTERDYMVELWNAEEQRDELLVLCKGLVDLCISYRYLWNKRDHKYTQRLYKRHDELFKLSQKLGIPNASPQTKDL